MGISLIISLTIICFLILFILGGFFLIRKRWKLGMMLITPPVAVGILIIGTIIYVSHHTNPDSLELSIHQKPPKDSNYTVRGKWNDRIDYYSFGTDFVAICTKDNERVDMVDYIKGDWKPNYYSFDTDIPYQIEQNTNLPEGCVPQLFDLKVQKDFSFSFLINDREEEEPITIYYVHVRMDPMDAPSYWVKTLSIQ